MQDIQLRAPGVRHISGSEGPRLASTSQPQSGASKRLRLSEEVKRRLLEMCVGEQVPVSGPVATVGGIIFETLSPVTHTRERASKIMAPTVVSSHNIISIYQYYEYYHTLR